MSNGADGYQGTPATTDREKSLRQAFMAGKALSSSIGMRIAEWKAPGIDKLFPTNTLRKMEMAARIHFASGCSLLYESWLSYAADNHLRSLLEIFSHVAWIAGRGIKEPPMTDAARARCYELAMLNGLIEEVLLFEELAQKVEPSTAVASSRTQIEKVREALLVEHSADSCTCRGMGHGFWQVSRVLKAMSSAPEGQRLRLATWTYTLWRYTSRLDHHAGFERMLRFGDGRNWIGPAEDWQRVQTFIWLISIYGSIAGWVTELYSQALADQFIRELGELSRNPAVIDVAKEHPEAFSLREQRDADKPKESFQDHRIEIFPDPEERQPRSWRWRCVCGSSSGGRRYESEQESIKAAERHVQAE
jgi:hypothetical protein